jgi:chemotaxis protein methyltransferase CheR
VSGLELSAPELQEVARVLARATGLSLASGLLRTLRNGLLAAAEELAMTPLDLARKVIAGDPHGVAVLIEHAVVGETYFYRHPEQLGALVGALAPRDGPLRIWSAGCATGEEPYSVAMALLGAGRAGRGDRIVATDVSERALRTAQAGVYNAWSLRRMPAAARSGHLEGEGRWRVSDEARFLVEFRRHNLVADPPPGAFDAVLCRNVLIYFEPQAAAEIVFRLASAVIPGGYLVLSPVELPLAAPMALEWVEAGGGTILRRPTLP